jgi:hypothetical protein
MNEQARDFVGRQGPLTVKAGERNGTAIDALEVQPHQPKNIARHDHYDRDKRDTRQAIDQSQAHRLQRLQKDRQEPRPKRPRPGIKKKHKVKIEIAEH